MTAQARGGQRRITTADRVLIAGTSGAGKSTIAAYLVNVSRAGRSGGPALLAVDPKGEWDLGVTPCSGVGELQRTVRRGQRRVHWIPEDCDDREQLDAGYRVCAAIPGPLWHWEDEAAETTRTSWAPGGLRTRARLGRARREGLIVVTQRLAECHPVIRTQATHILIPAPGPPELDLRMLAGHCGMDPGQLRCELEECHAAAGQWAHLWHCVPTRHTRWMSAVPLVDWPALRRP